jgi:ribosomal protein S12 methylthiotransferase accessory factor
MIYRDALERLGELDCFPLDGMDRFGVPVWTATLWGETPMHGVGYGTTAFEARRGALGELAESVAVHAAVRALPRTEGTHAELSARTAALDPRAACLPAGSPYTPRTPLAWVPSRRLRDGAEVLVPIELVASCFADLDGIEAPSGDWLTTPITNGLGAGDTPARAIAHGILELLQRDGNSVTYRALDRGVVVEPDEIRDPELAELLARVDAAGTELRIKLAATDFGMANVYVVGWDRDLDTTAHPLMVTSCGEAVHPDRERAVRKAVLEYLSSRARKAFCQSALDALGDVAPERYRRRIGGEGPLHVEEDRALDAMLAWLGRDAGALRRAMLDGGFHAERERVPLSALPTTALPDDPEALLEHLAGALHGAGMDVLVVDLPADGWHAARVIVPGLEVETATYHRIGARNLARLAGTGLAGTGEMPAGALPVPAVPGAWLDAAAIDARVGDLYPLYREPDRHVAGRVLAGAGR